MSIDQLTPTTTGNRFAAIWRALRRSYRIANRVTHHALSKLFKLAVLVYFVFGITVLVLRYLVLPDIGNYKADVERLATRALGNKVAIATIDASWSGLHPTLALGQVVIYDKSGNEALKLPHVSATLSWWSVPAADLRLHSLEIDNPDMDVLRDADGRLYVAGIPVNTGKSDNGRGADWVLSQREIRIRDGKLRWTDRKRGAPELMLDQVNFTLRNEWHHHRFALRAVPPPALAAPLDLRAAFDHPHFTRRISDVSLWKGELYADLRDTDLASWKPYVDYPIDLQRGRGSVRAWLDFDRSKVANFTADLTLGNVATRLRKDLEPLNLNVVSGRISVREAINSGGTDGTPTFGANGHAIALTDFSLQTEDGLVLPRTSISESYVPARGKQLEKTEVHASLLDLEAISRFVERLPLPSAQRELLADFAPRGTLRDFSVQWQGAYPNLAAYNVKGQFAGLSLKPQAARPARPRSGKLAAQAAIPAIPGFDNLTGRVDANDRGGSFSLASEQLKLELPGYLPQPVMPFDRLTMQASWTIQNDNRLLLEVAKMDFLQEGLSGSLSGRHLLSLGQSGKRGGMLELNGKLDGLELAKVQNYLPEKTPPVLRTWLGGALVGGTAHDLKIHVKGDPAQFPFRPAKPGEKPTGEFSISGRIEEGKMNYTPSLFAGDGKAPFWPLLEDINGTIAFDRTRMEIHAISAATSGVSLSDVKAVVPDLADHDTQLQIDGDANGLLQDFVRFTNDSPVAGWIGKFTEETKAAGNAKLALQLRLPLARLAEAKVHGELQFVGNNVTLQTALPPLLGTKGKLEFNEKGFTLAGIHASFLGGPVVVSGGTQRDGTTLVRAEGTLLADSVRRNYGMPTTQRSTDRVSGSARYTTSIRIKNKRPEIVIESGLQGLALDFPAPLRKTAGEVLPLRFELNSLPSNDADTARDEIKLALGSAIAARYERQRNVKQQDADWQVVRGGIGVNVPAPLPDSGLIINASMRSLDVDAWRRAVSALGAPASTAGNAVNPAKAASSAAIAQYLDPDVLAARATELVVMGRKLDNVVVGASHQKGVWQANIDSEQASGYVTWNESPSGQGLGRVTARLASLLIPKSAASDVTELLEGKDTTIQMPAVDIVAENFELFGKKFGHIELIAYNPRGAVGREWRIGKLAIANPDGELRATGKWTSNNGQNLSSLNYVLNIADAGRLLDRFGFPNVLRAGKGKMEGELNWKGQLYSLDIPSLSGRLQLDLAAGQFLKADPGAAKLIGVLSLQSLPRRLALDFRDVFSEGIAFDGITATAAINQGIAKTDNFKMRGVAATVLLDGSADIANETQNLHVVVIPEINAGAASVVYALAVNPVIGVGSFLAQLFLRDPLMKAFTFELQVTGPWKDPVVTKLQRNHPGAAPAGEVANPAMPNG